jgi:hypothetical protein
MRDDLRTGALGMQEMMLEHSNKSERQRLNYSGVPRNACGVIMILMVVGKPKGELNGHILKSWYSITVII